MWRVNAPHRGVPIARKRPNNLSVLRPQPRNMRVRTLVLLQEACRASVPFKLKLTPTPRIMARLPDVPTFAPLFNNEGRREE